MFIQLHRPTQFLTYICSNHILFASLLCLCAARYNNIPALDILYTPTTRGGTVLWGEQICATAALHGHLDTLIWFRDFTTGGGACPWDQQQCLNIAQKHNHTHIATWICVQHGNNP